MSLFLLRIREAFARVENTQVIHKLHIAFLEVQRDRMLLRQKVQVVERFGLGFGDGWDVCGTWKTLEAGEGAASVLDDEALGRGVCCGLAVEGTRYVRFRFVAEAGVGQYRGVKVVVRLTSQQATALQAFG